MSFETWAASAFGYALAAMRARGVFGGRRAVRLFERAGGTLLVGAGPATAVAKSGN